MPKKPITVKEYREKLIRTIQTPSGLTWQVKTLTTPLPFLKLISKYQFENPDKLNPVEMMERSDQILKELFREYVLSPKIGDELPYEEILEQDKTPIFNTIMEKVQTQFFRENKQSNNSRRATAIFDRDSQ